MEPSYTQEQIKALLAKTNPVIAEKRKAADARAPVDHRPPKYLYHYTTTTALLSILKDGAFWATDIRYMNDADELAYPKRLVEAAIETALTRSTTPSEIELLKRLENTFDFRDLFQIMSISLSASDDDLHQWRGYGGGAGDAVALSLETRWFGKHVDLMSVLYDETEQRGIIDAAIADVLDIQRRFSSDAQGELETFLIAECCGYLRSVLAPHLLRFKSPYWKNEQEWRVVLPLAGRDGLKFRPGRFGLIPYVEVPLVVEGPCKPIPLREVVIGPHPHQELASLSMGVYLAIGRTGAMVRKSRVPLR